MAQAARLNLRMQKELKLLLTDPPPGASFPSLSTDAPPSLSSIEAQIEGPEGTVYAGGFFKLKIQIPDRYPFQPPNVTFATPIYHPNIDTGGRICLDILNLPPKGAWQPSLNISTVLTSIGQLLSEPNPDDGLMQEASQEFKYNRQVFDQKARSMTEKFARNGACETAAVAGQEYHAPSLDCAEAKGSDTSMEEVHHYLGANKRFCGISRKLSLESSELDRERIVGKSVNEGPTEHSERELESKRLKQEPCKMTIGLIRSHQDPLKMSKKLSLEPSTSNHVNKGNNITSLVSVKGKSTLRTGCSEALPSVEVSSDFEQKYNNCDERSKPITASIKPEKEKLLQPMDSKLGNTDEQEKLLSVSKEPSPKHHSSETSRNLLLLNTESHDKSKPHSAVVNGDGNIYGIPRIKHKKLGLAGRHFSSGLFLSRQSQENAKTENQPPTSTIPQSNSSKNLLPSSKDTVDHSGTCSDHRQPLKPLSQISNRNTVNSQSEMESKVSAAQHISCFDEKLQSKKQKTVAPPADMDKLIALDSEDSDEDQRATARLKLSLARRRLKGKSK